MDEKLNAAQERSDVEWILSTAQGRRFTWRLLGHCGIYRDIEGSGDEVFKQVGRRQVGLFLLGLISDASEDRLFEMMREAKNKSIEEKLNYERTESGHNIDEFIGELPGYSDGGPEF